MDWKKLKDGECPECGNPCVSIEKRKVILEFILAEKALSRAEGIEEAREILRNYPKQLIELNHGKLPWVIWEGKVDEEERVKIFMHAFEQAFKSLASLTPKEDKI